MGGKGPSLEVLADSVVRPSLIRLAWLASTAWGLVVGTIAYFVGYRPSILGYTHDVIWASPLISFGWAFLTARLWGLRLMAYGAIAYWIYGGVRGTPEHSYELLICAPVLAIMEIYYVRRVRRVRAILVEARDVQVRQPSDG